MVKRLLLLLLIPFMAFAASPRSQFKQAQDRFNLWYSGPLLTGSAYTMEPGEMGIQPYVFLIDNYGFFNGDRRAHSLDDSYIQFIPEMNAIQAGVTPWLDISFAFGAEVNWQDEHHSGSLTDSTLTLGFPLMTETACLPAMKLGIGETFPTGRFQKFKPKKGATSATGLGAFQTTLSYRISKIVLWTTCYPLNVRASFAYTIPTIVHVKGLNSYGGGFKTKGRVHLGNSFNADIGLELSFAKKWVFVSDFVYSYFNHAEFVGNPGFNADGSTASVGYHSSDEFSFSPAFEYNPNSRLSFIGGAWLSVTGRNISNFASVFIGASYTFCVID